MRKRNVRRSLRGRVAYLEAELKGDEGLPMRLGYVVRILPPEYSGESHFAVMRVVGFDNWRREWCEVEERPGPAPRNPAERLPAVCFTETEMKIAFGPDFKWPGL